jgi:hypothetical protein
MSLCILLPYIVSSGMSGLTKIPFKTSAGKVSSNTHLHFHLLYNKIGHTFILLTPLNFRHCKCKYIAQRFNDDASFVDSP